MLPNNKVIKPNIEPTMSWRPSSLQTRQFSAVQSLYLKDRVQYIFLGAFPNPPSQWAEFILLPSSTRPSLDHLEVLLDQLQTTQDHYWPILDHLEVCYGYSRGPSVASPWGSTSWCGGPPSGPPTLNRTPITGRSCHRRPNGNKMVYWAATAPPGSAPGRERPRLNLILLSILSSSGSAVTTLHTQYIFVLL